MNARRYGTSLCAALAIALITLPVQGQESDGRWLPFVGCWAPTESEADSGLLCFRLAGGGVEMFSVAGGEIVSSERLVADGVARPVAAEGCEGSESIEFSADGRRAFTRSDFVCDGIARSGTGVMSFRAPTMWVDVRSLDMDGEAVTWVQAYGAVGTDRMAEAGVEDPVEGHETGVRTARIVASQTIALDDVEDAVEHVDEKAVETWVASQGDEFRLTARELVRLADSGFPESIIDVMVAVSYPERFVVEPDEPITEADSPNAYRGYRGYMAYDPYRRSRWGFGYQYGYSPFGYGAGYGYSPYGFYNPGYGGYYGYTPTVINVGRRPSSGGRIVNGQGYRRGGSSSAGTATRRPGSRGGGSSARPSPSAGSRGATSGSSGSRGTAVRRGGGAASGSASSSGAAKRRPGGS